MEAQMARESEDASLMEMSDYINGRTEKFRTASEIQSKQLTTKILKQLGDRETVSKEFIQNLTKAPGISATEAKIITDMLE
jgi:hypothetical protein